MVSENMFVLKYISVFYTKHTEVNFLLKVKVKYQIGIQTSYTTPSVPQKASNPIFQNFIIGRFISTCSWPTSMISHLIFSSLYHSLYCCVKMDNSFMEVCPCLVIHDQQLKQFKICINFLFIWIEDYAVLAFWIIY